MADAAPAVSQPQNSQDNGPFSGSPIEPSWLNGAPAVRSAPAQQPPQGEAPPVAGETSWEGPPIEPTWLGPQQKAAAPEGPSKARIASGALAKMIDDQTVAGGKVLGGIAVLADKAHGAFSGRDETGMQDWWFKHAVDPYVQRQIENTLGPDASLGDRATYGVTYTAAQLAEYFTGARLLGAGATLGERLAGGAGAMLPPAVSGAVNVGQSVLDATGNKEAAAKAAAMSYVMTTTSGLVPMAMRGGLAARAASGAAVGAGLEEIPRIAQNTQMPEGLKEPFDPLNFTIAAATGGIMGAAMGPRGEPNTQVKEVRPAAHEDVLTHAQQAAEATARAAGGDTLDGVVAATTVNADLSAHHDAAAAQGAREQEALDHANALQSHQAAEAQQQLPLGEQQLPLPGMGEGGEQPAPGQGELPLNEPAQPGQQELLPPEQQSVLDRMKAERAPTEAQEPGKETPTPAIPPKEAAAPAPAGEAAVKDRMAAIAAAAKGREQPPLVKPEGGEPTTLAERKAALSNWAGRTTNNASGESAASQEAVNRVAEEKAKGVQRFEVDADGNRAPLTGVDAVDARAPKGGLVIQRDAQGVETILDRGGLNQLAANGLLNRSKARASFSNQDIAQDIAPGLRMDKAEVQAHIQPVIDRMPPDMQKGINVHDHPLASSVPENIRAEATQYNHKDARGVYDPKSDSVHLFAQGHWAGDAEDLHNTLVHESIHRGLRRSLGADWEGTMNDVMRSAPQAGKQWMRDYATQHGLDMSKSDHSATVADEYATHLALGEAKTDPTAWQKIVDTVRGWAAKVGIGKYMSDDDIRDMVMRNNTGISKLVAPGRPEPMRWSDPREDNLKRLASSFPDDHPTAIGARLGMTQEEQTKYAPSAATKVKDAMQNLGYKTIPNMLATIDMRHLPDFVSAKDMPSAQKFLQTNDASRGRRGRFQQEAGQRLQDWSKWANKNQDQNSLLGTVMHGSTIAGVDPSKDYAPRWAPEETATDPAKAAAEAQRQAVHARLQGMYERLDGTGQKLYNDVRDDYTTHRNATWKALEARINETGASGEAKQTSLASLRRMFEASTVAGPYFPLARFGDYWGRAMDQNGDHVSFTRFENPAERKQWLKNMTDQGFKVEAGTKDNNRALMDKINPEFVRQVMDVAKDSPGLQDEIWQTYLRSMPEMSMRKQFIHRQGRLGFTADAMRAYAFNTTHGAMQIARLEYGNRMDNLVQQMRQEADTVNNAEPGTWKAEMLRNVANEFGKRNDWIKNPQNSGWTSAVNQAGFAWYLGAAPATAFRIHTQNSMLASPILAAKFGQLGATKELNRAVMQWARAKGDLGDTLRGDERQAFQEAGDQGMFTNTWAATLAASASGRSLTGRWANIRDTTMNAAQYMFNAIEHKNRMTTFLASYRLGRAQGMDHDSAVQTANQMTWDAHLDYGNDNRARFLQNDFMKVAGQFKQYPLGVAYRLARDFRNSLPGIAKNENLTPQQITQARKQFGGILLRSFMYSGAVGLPAMWAAEAGINMAMSDKDTPFDAREAAHSSLEQQYGRSVADAIMYGPVSAVTGASLSGGASYSDLLYKTPAAWHEMTTAEKMTDAAEQALGPAWGAVTNMGMGLDIGAKGNWERGIEHMMPPSLVGPTKAARLATQGAQNLRGEQIMTPEELGDGWSKSLGVPSEAIRDKNLFLQSLGLTPQVLTDRYQQNSVIKSMQRQIMDRRRDLEDQVENAVNANDDAGAERAMAAIDKFNDAHPGVPINPVKGVVSYMKANAKKVHGVTIKPGLQSEMERYGGGQ